MVDPAKPRTVTKLKSAPLLRSLILVLAVALCTSCGRKSPFAENLAKAQRAKIESEIQKLGPHAWAGEYYAGDGKGMNTTLILAPTAGYVFEWHGFTGLYDRNYSAVVWTNNRIRLSFKFQNIRKGFAGLASEFVPVRWGERRYLIAADEMAGFCSCARSAALGNRPGRWQNQARSRRDSHRPLP